MNAARSPGSASSAQIPIPPQPGPAVQETTFAADARDEMEVLEHEPIPEDDEDDDGGRPTTNHARTAAYDSLLTHRHHHPLTTKQSPPPSQTRSIPPDLLRGLLMVLMALDHNVMTLRSWPHSSVADGFEGDSAPVHAWNPPLGFVVRTLTHLCAPGFVFLLGMGIVYFGRSRKSLAGGGWGGTRMVGHFVSRGAVLMAVSVAMGGVLTLGQVWLFNVALGMLAVDFVIAGVGWTVLGWMEGMVAFLILKMVPRRVLMMGGKRKGGVDNGGNGEGGEREPLLGDRGDGDVVEGMASDRSIIRAADISWHLHNVVLAGLAVVTVWWNIWLSPTGGHCQLEDGAEPKKFPEYLWFRIWFYVVQTPHILSTFPPLPWLSFAILGLLYGRIILARSWSTKAIAFGNALAGVGFSIIFVLTRLHHFGNLSEGCLHLPEHLANPERNQYFASVQSFFYLVKYPPDVAFWAFTMAANFFLLALFSIIPSHFAARGFKILLVFGTSALFFYVTHIFLLFALSAWVMIPLLGHEMPFKDELTGKPAIGVDQTWAFFLNVGVVLSVLYPACIWYSGFKRTTGPDSIWRFF